MLEKLDSLQVFIVPILVGHPVPGAASVIQIQHGGDSIYPQAVDMILLDPVDGIGNKEVGNLMLPVIKHLGAPVRMLPFPGVRILVQRLAVKIRQAVGISGEMSRNPVQNDADPLFVQVIHKIHKICGGSITGGRRIITCHLVAPGHVQGMLGDGHQLHMGVAHIFYIRCQFMGGFYVSVIPVFFFPVLLLPGSQMNLIDRKRAGKNVLFLPFLHPGVIFPLKTGDIPGDRCGAGPILRPEGIGVSFKQNLSA